MSKPKLRKVKTCNDCENNAWGSLGAAYNPRRLCHNNNFEHLLDGRNLPHYYVCDEWSAKDE